MTQARSEEEFRKILVKLAMKHKVPSQFIARRLLSLEDKADIMEGLIGIETVDYHVKMWREEGMKNYADGSGEIYEHFRLYSEQP